MRMSSRFITLAWTPLGPVLVSPQALAADGLDPDKLNLETRVNDGQPTQASNTSKMHYNVVRWVPSSSETRLTIESSTDVVLYIPIPFAHSLKSFTNFPKALRYESEL